MSDFNLFVPVPPGATVFAGGLPAGCTQAGQGSVRGTVYDLSGTGRVLMLYGDTPVTGEIWCCPDHSLRVLDARAGVGEGMRRRVARRVSTAGGGEPVPCWLYVAGPALSRSLLPERRIANPEAGRLGGD